jgi:hypothetical protein
MNSRSTCAAGRSCSRQRSKNSSRSSRSTRIRSPESFAMGDSVAIGYTLLQRKGRPLPDELLTSMATVVEDLPPEVAIEPGFEFSPVFVGDRMAGPALDPVSERWIGTPHLPHRRSRWLLCHSSIRRACDSALRLPRYTRHEGYTAAASRKQYLEEIHAASDLPVPPSVLSSGCDPKPRASRRDPGTRQLKFRACGALPALPLFLLCSSRTSRIRTTKRCCVLDSA